MLNINIKCIVSINTLISLKQPDLIYLQNINFTKASVFYYPTYKLKSQEFKILIENGLYKSKIKS